MKHTIFAAVAAVSTVLSGVTAGSMAHAQSTTESCSGFSETFKSSGLTLADDLPKRIGGYASGTVTMNKGDTFTANVTRYEIGLTSAKSANKSESIGFLGGMILSAYGGSLPGCKDCDSFSHTATEDGEIVNWSVSSLYGRIGPGTDEGSVSGASRVELSCSAAPVEETVENNAAPSAAAATAGATGSAVGKAVRTATNGRNNSGGGGAGRLTDLSLSETGLFFAARPENNDGQFWGALEGRWFNGDIDGDGAELTLGADWELPSGLIIGGILSVGSYDLEAEGSEVEISSLTYGPYLSKQVSDLYSIDALITYSRPEYDIDGTEFTAERWAGDIRATADYSMGANDVSSFVSIGGYRERQPGAGALAERDISQVRAAIGTKIIFNPMADFRPFVSMAAEHVSFDAGAGADRVSHTSPRIGLGFAYDINGGRIDFDLDGGEFIEGTRDVGLLVRYSIDF